MSFKKGYTPWNKKPDKFCLDCGKKLSKSHKPKRCKVCSANERIKRFPLKSGKESIRYIDGRRIYRHLIEIKKCILCSSIKKLFVHHIDKNRKNNDINNLMVVCASCHKKILHPNKIFYGNQYLKIKK